MVSSHLVQSHFFCSEFIWREKENLYKNNRQTFLCPKNIVQKSKTDFAKILPIPRGIAGLNFVIFEEKFLKPDFHLRVKLHFKKFFLLLALFFFQEEKLMSKK